jgi:hypothetical protein
MPLSPAEVTAQGARADFQVFGNLRNGHEYLHAIGLVYRPGGFQKNLSPFFPIEKRPPMAKNDHQRPPKSFLGKSPLSLY